jgi:GAF domain-containing protein
MTEARQKVGGRTVLGVPLLREGRAIGVIMLLRQSVRPFTDKQIELATTFADQAVIAIENVRLFEQVQKRTEELTESLQQQTATANVLEVISRSAFDLQPVFDTVAESCVRLCGADRAFIFRFDGELLRMQRKLDLHRLKMAAPAGLAIDRTAGRAIEKIAGSAPSAPASAPTTS